MWFEVRFDYSDYLCRDSAAGFQRYDCYASFSGTEPPLAAYSPDVYCSGARYSLNCDRRWYPNALLNVEFVTMGGVDYVCEPSYGGSFGDYDCGTYLGGDPNLTWTKELKRTDRGYEFECGYDYYPSELDGLEIIYIGGSEYMCQGSWGGSECFRYFGGSPLQATFGFPDLYCSFQGLCDEWDYP